MKLSEILKIISKFKTENPDTPTLYHVNACRNMALPKFSRTSNEKYTGNKLTRQSSFSLDYIRINFNFLKKLHEKMRILERNEEFKKIKKGKKSLYSQILDLYKEFKLLLKDICTAPMWQYNFFNIILESPINDIPTLIEDYKWLY